jgi:hypothetical protein
VQRDQESREAKQVTKDYDRGYKESQKEQMRGGRGGRKMPKQFNVDEEERKQKTLKKWADFPNGYHKAMKYRPW